MNTIQPRSYSSILRALASLVSASLLATGTGHAAMARYYIGVDGQQTIPTGTYAGQANPNYNRLTLLYAHENETSPSSNHYHSKGIYRYTPGSPVENPTIEISPSNYLPEGALPPLVLGAGTGLYEGKLTTIPDEANHFSQLTIRDTQELSGAAAGSSEHYMFNSSAGRWTTTITGADVHLQLVNLSAGLNIGSNSALSVGLLQSGDELHLGGNVDFTPVFWVEENAAPGVYTADFKLADEEGIYGDSGTFQYRFQVIPEPSTAMLSGGAMILGALRRRRN